MVIWDNYSTSHSYTTCITCNGPAPHMHVFLHPFHRFRVNGGIWVPNNEQPLDGNTSLPPVPDKSLQSVIV